MDATDTFNGSDRNFLVVAHRARTDGDFGLNDLCGAAGRLDGILRCINASLFLSHGMRRDTSVHAVLLGPSDPPKVLSVNGMMVRYLNPDERSTASLVKKALSIPLSQEHGAWAPSTPGITVTRGDLGYVLSLLKGSVFLLDEDGEDLGEAIRKGSIGMGTAPVHFILSDDRDHEEAERALLSRRADMSLSLSPQVLHADHAITVAHNFLDRAWTVRA